MKKYIGNIITAAVFIGLAIHFEAKIIQFAKIAIPVFAGLVGWLIWKNTGQSEVNKLK